MSTSHRTNAAVLCILAGVTSFLSVLVVKQQESPKSPPSASTVASVEIGDTTLAIPTWSLFRTGDMWSLVSAKRTLPVSFTPDLVAVSVPAYTEGLKVSAKIATPLASLFQAAAADGVSLMLSSAYRSAEEQRALAEGYLAARGPAYVAAYIAAPGASEHQTGLAVDIATADSACRVNSDKCSLDRASIEWLRAHAKDYGFIERYPFGKASITGIEGEAWHYRYVGVPLARALTAANMTLDEFVTQTAPGYAHN